MSQQNKNIVYLRVSTVAQDLENQQHGILEYVQRENIQPVEFHEETVSGKTPVAERLLGKEIIPALNKGDSLIVAELSRLGRDMYDIMSVLGELNRKGIKVHAVKGNYKLDGSMSSKILTMVFSIVGEIERELISQRTKEALARRKASGLPLGRPKGSFGVSKLDKHEEEIRQLAKHGVSKSAMARIFNCSWPTMDNWIKSRNI
jgi:DNA invertase Pin-like site-specific DNA recombinase